jgi:hypothetical protein
VVVGVGEVGEEQVHPDLRNLLLRLVVSRDLVHCHSRPDDVAREYNLVLLVLLHDVLTNRPSIVAPASIKYCFKTRKASSSA